MKDYWACKEAFELAISEKSPVIVHYFAAGIQTCEGIPIEWGRSASLFRSSDGMKWNVLATFVTDVTRPRVRLTPSQPRTRAITIG